MTPGGDSSRSSAPKVPRTDRLVALFLGAAVAFNPPLLRVFGAGDTLFGWPLLYVYVFAVWGGVIALSALHLERGEGDQ